MSAECMQITRFPYIGHYYGPYYSFQFARYSVYSSHRIQWSFYTKTAWLMMSSSASGLLVDDFHRSEAGCLRVDERMMMSWSCSRLGQWSRPRRFADLVSTENVNSGALIFTSAHRWVHWHTLSHRSAARLTTDLSWTSCFFLYLPPGGLGTETELQAWYLVNSRLTVRPDWKRSSMMVTDEFGWRRLPWRRRRAELSRRSDNASAKLNWTDWLDAWTRLDRTRWSTVWLVMTWLSPTDSSRRRTSWTDSRIEPTGVVSGRYQEARTTRPDHCVRWITFSGPLNPQCCPRTRQPCPDHDYQPMAFPCQQAGTGTPSIPSLALQTSFTSPGSTY